MANLNLETIHIPTLDEAKQYIYSIDFSNLIDKLVNHLGWLRNDAEETCKLYRNFLYLNKKYLEEKLELPPSEDIDEFWHNHILDTEAYTKDCNAIFGKYFHHYPYFGIDENSNLQTLNKSFDLMKDLYFKEFGENLEPTRSGYPKIFYFLMKKFPLLDIT